MRLVISLSTSHPRIRIATSFASNAGCRTALSRLCVLLTGSYGDPIWLQAVLYASGGYVSRRDSFASRTRVYTSACLYLSITSFEKVAWDNARIKTLLLLCKIWNQLLPVISIISISQSPLSRSYFLDVSIRRFLARNLADRLATILVTRIIFIFRNTSSQYELSVILHGNFSNNSV